jgi:PAS domain S-box-containing protein
MFDELEPEISTTAAEMATSIDREFQVQNATSQTLIAQTRAVLLTTTAVAVLAGVSLAILLSRYLTERLQAENALRQYRDHLERLVEARTAELTRTNERLRQEIAERERTEAALRESEASLARAQEIGHLGSWSLDYTQDKAEWSDEMYRLLDLTPDDAQAPIFELGFSRVHPKDREALQTIYRESVDAGKSGFETEFRTVPIDGQTHTHRVLAEIEWGDDGEVARLFGIDIDITAQKQAEEALRRSEEHFRQLFEANPFPLVISQRAGGKILMANQAAADHMDLPMETLIGGTTLNFYADSADRQSIIRILEQQGKVTNFVLRARTHAGLPRVMLLNVIAFERDAESLLLVGFVDITTQVEAEEVAQAARAEAEAANRAKSMFLANMSHELRTPLNAILGFSDLMAHNSNLTREQYGNLRTIGRSGEHLLVLINDVLDLSKIESGKIELETELFDLQEMLLGLGEMFSLRAEEKDLTVVFDLAPDVPRYIRVDVGKLRQVLINLLGNAVKFTERGGITVRVSAQEFGRRGPPDRGESA